ncbi:hypothetical protein [Capnocytophaga felis]|uniref:Uncharacterized protein n=1 Tax=Capnocytophaga felis TaxID=2267611 RepID=A0A5M4BBX3_9FLAO|nr:hypothetical protein [Capnocytophaga felis]GET46747.1 hypothetical protein RCZ01_20490 [Capnocytophaga felis]GET48447.1 hypothetical protein RCZ02_12780 [Capnocytophaga felis]
MRIGTRLTVLLYKNNTYQRAIEISTNKYRLDDGIGYSFWDINQLDKEEDMKRYQLTEEEYEAVQFEYFWLEDLLVRINDYHFEMDYSKVTAKGLSKPSKLKELLERIYLIEREHIQEDFSALSSKIRSHRQDLTQIKVYMGGIPKAETSNFNEVLSAMDDIERKYIGHYDKMSFINLLGILTGTLMDITDDYDIKIIMFAG